jgi:hypothetical protein
MMGVHDMRARLDLDERFQQTWRDRIRGMATYPAHGSQRPDSQTTGLALGTCMPAKGKQFAVDLAGQGARQFERVALAATE